MNKSPNDIGNLLDSLKSEVIELNQRLKPDKYRVSSINNECFNCKFKCGSPRTGEDKIYFITHRFLSLVDLDFDFLQYFKKSFVSKEFFHSLLNRFQYETLTIQAIEMLNLMIEHQIQNKKNITHTRDASNISVNSIQESVRSRDLNRSQIHNNHFQHLPNSLEHHYSQSVLDSLRKKQQSEIQTNYFVAGGGGHQYNNSFRTDRNYITEIRDYQLPTDNHLRLKTDCSTYNDPVQLNNSGPYLSPQTKPIYSPPIKIEKQYQEDRQMKEPSLLFTPNIKVDKPKTDTLITMLQKARSELTLQNTKFQKQIKPNDFKQQIFKKLQKQQQQEEYPKEKPTEMVEKLEKTVQTESTQTIPYDRYTFMPGNNIYDEQQQTTDKQVQTEIKIKKPNNYETPKLEQFDNKDTNTQLSPHFTTEHTQNESFSHQRSRNQSQTSMSVDRFPKVPIQKDQLSIDYVQKKQKQTPDPHQRKFNIITNQDKQKK